MQVFLFLYFRFWSIELHTQYVYMHKQRTGPDMHTVTLAFTWKSNYIHISSTEWNKDRLKTKFFVVQMSALAALTSRRAKQLTQWAVILYQPHTSIPRPLESYHTEIYFSIQHSTPTAQVQLSLFPFLHLTTSFTILKGTTSHSHWNLTANHHNSCSETSLESFLPNYFLQISYMSSFSTENL